MTASINPTRDTVSELAQSAEFRAAIRDARARGLPSVVWTFDPPPKVFFGRAPLLMSPVEKVVRLASLGVDQIILTRFDAEFRAHSAEDFLDDLMSMHPAEAWVGDDFRFGAGQKGDRALLETRVPVRLLDPVECAKWQLISSSRIRTHWQKGEFHRVKELIGWEDFYLHPRDDQGW